MKVHELFTAEAIDKEFMETKFEGDYWENCVKFVGDNWARDVSFLSDKQQSWLKKILDDCVEKKLEKE